jgi:hypothetical protein
MQMRWRTVLIRYVRKLWINCEECRKNLAKYGVNVWIDSERDALLPPIPVYNINHVGFRRLRGFQTRYLQPATLFRREYGTISDFVTWIEAHKPRTRSEANRLHDALCMVESQAIESKMDHGTHCDICGEPLVDMSQIFQQSTRICKNHGIRPIAVVRLIKGSDLMKKAF